MHTVDLWLCKNNSCYDWNDFLTYKTRLNMERFDRFSINFHMKISVLLYMFLRYAQFPYSIMRACVYARALFNHYFLLHFAIGLSDQSIKFIYLRDAIIQVFFNSECCWSNTERLLALLYHRWVFQMDIFSIINFLIKILCYLKYIQLN